ncbi:MAG TPA: hypothetical protein VFS43_46510 [Polyangiaceae bacterium]|nr:hypothetical protein [Polyangiaceae bacterium]
MPRYLGRWRKAGSLAPRPPGGGRPRALDARAEHLLRELLREQSDLPDHEYARRLAERLGRPVSRQAVNRACKRMGVTREGKVLRVTKSGEPNAREG